MIRPTNSHILTKIITKGPLTEEGLLLPEGAKAPAQRAKVIAVGSGTDLEPMEAKVGDVVLFTKGAGREVLIDDEEYLMLTTREVIGFDE